MISIYSTWWNIKNTRQYPCLSLCRNMSPSKIWCVLKEQRTEQWPCLKKLISEFNCSFWLHLLTKREAEFHVIHQIICTLKFLHRTQKCYRCPAVWLFTFLILCRAHSHWPGPWAMICLFWQVWLRTPLWVVQYESLPIYQHILSTPSAGVCSLVYDGSAWKMFPNSMNDTGYCSTKTGSPRKCMLR